MKKIALLISVLLLTSARCSPAPKIDPDANDDPKYCAAGCEHIATLVGQDGEPGCLESRPLTLPDEVCSSADDCNIGSCVDGLCVLTCEDFCIDQIKNGNYMGPKCWTTIEFCAEIEEICR